MTLSQIVRPYQALRFWNPVTSDNYLAYMLSINLWKTQSGNLHLLSHHFREAHIDHYEILTLGWEEAH